MPHPDLPIEFVQRIRHMREDADALLNILDTEAPNSIRFNPFKKLPETWLPVDSKVSWSDNGYYLSERPAYGKDVMFHAGSYYPMEASSMFLENVLTAVELRENAVILDLCAAPGGKTLILKDYFPEQLLISNEIHPKRAAILKENVVKWGTANHIVTNGEATDFGESDLKFDLVLVDAPCSGEGLFRKDPDSRKEWSTERATGCALRQKEILEDVMNLVDDGGYLIYSTCTYNPEENIERIQQVLSKGNWQSIPVHIDDSWGIEKLNSEELSAYQFWPDKTKGEGFFLSVLKKDGEPEYNLDEESEKSVSHSALINEKLSELILHERGGKYFGYTQAELAAFYELKSHLKIVKNGIYLGEEKGDDFLYSYDLAMRPDLQRIVPAIEISNDQMLDYLKGNALAINYDRGVYFVAISGLPIGPVKSNGSRLNNLYPKHLRLR